MNRQSFFAAIVVLAMVGCGEEAEPPATFQKGQSVTIKLTGDKGYVMERVSRTHNPALFRVRFTTDFGEHKLVCEDNFAEFELQPIMESGGNP